MAEALRKNYDEDRYEENRHEIQMTQYQEKKLGHAAVMAAIDNLDKKIANEKEQLAGLERKRDEAQKRYEEFGGTSSKTKKDKHKRMERDIQDRNRAINKVRHNIDKYERQKMDLAVEATEATMSRAQEVAESVRANHQKVMEMTGMEVPNAEEVNAVLDDDAEKRAEAKAEAPEMDSIEVPSNVEIEQNLGGGSTLAEVRDNQNPDYYSESTQEMMRINGVTPESAGRREDEEKQELARAADEESAHEQTVADAERVMNEMAEEGLTAKEKLENIESDNEKMESLEDIIRKTELTEKSNKELLDEMMGMIDAQLSKKNRDHQIVDELVKRQEAEEVAAAVEANDETSAGMGVDTGERTWASLGIEEAPAIETGINYDENGWIDLNSPAIPANVRSEMLLNRQSVENLTKDGGFNDLWAQLAQNEQAVIDRIMNQGEAVVENDANGQPTDEELGELGENNSVEAAIEAAEADAADETVEDIVEKADNGEKLTDAEKAELQAEIKKSRFWTTVKRRIYGIVGLAITVLNMSGCKDANKDATVDGINVGSPDAYTEAVAETGSTDKSEIEAAVDDAIEGSNGGFYANVDEIDAVAQETGLTPANVEGVLDTQYEVSDGGSIYNYDHFKSLKKERQHNVGEDCSWAWGDREATAQCIVDNAVSPEAVAQYAWQCENLLASVGLDGNMSYEELEAYLQKPENAEVQKKLAAALETALFDEASNYDFFISEKGSESSFYMKHAQEAEVIARVQAELGPNATPEAVAAAVAVELSQLDYNPENVILGLDYDVERDGTEKQVTIRFAVRDENGDIVGYDEITINMPCIQRTIKKTSGEEKVGDEKIGEEGTGEDTPNDDDTPDDDTDEDIKTEEEGTAEEIKTQSEKTGEEKNGEEKTGEEKTGEEKTGEEKNGEEKTGEEKNGEEKTGEEKAADEKTGEEKAADEKVGEEKAADEKVGEEKAADEKTGEEKAADEKVGEENIAEKNPEAEIRNATEGIDGELDLTDDIEKDKDQPQTDTPVEPTEENLNNINQGQEGTTEEQGQQDQNNSNEITDTQTNGEIINETESMNGNTGNTGNAGGAGEAGTGGTPTTQGETPTTTTTPETPTNPETPTGGTGELGGSELGGLTAPTGEPTTGM